MARESAQNLRNYAASELLIFIQKCVLNDQHGKSWITFSCLCKSVFIFLSREPFQFNNIFLFSASEKIH